MGGVGFTYLSRPRLPTGPLAMSQQRNPEMVLITTREFSHLGHLDFESERDGGAQTFVFSLEV